MTNKHRYTKLGDGQIRLLRIVATEPNIHAEFDVVSLNDPPTYNALSYAWGDPTPFDRAQIKDHYVETGRNLAIFLRHMGRHAHTPIWIDAVCINQEDDDEKSRQVRLMTAIYQNAAHVLVWLGPSADDSDRAMDAIARYGAAVFDAGLLHVPREVLMRWPDVGDDPAHVKCKTRLVELLTTVVEAEGDEAREAEQFPRTAFAALTHRPYYNRVWVKQELTHARDPVMLCGGRSTRVEHFHASLLFYGMLQVWEGLEWRAGRLARLPVTDDATLPSTTIGHLFAARWNYTQSQTLFGLHDILHTAYSWSNGPGLGCADPRDKIYGLLGCASDGAELGMVVDYSRSADAVFEDTARALISRKGIVDVLRWCRARRGRPPSWVPDWNHSVAFSRSDDVGIPLFRASGSRTQPLTAAAAAKTEASTPGMIRLRGCRVGTIIAAGSPFTSHAHKSFSYAGAKTLFAELEGYVFRRKEPSVYSHADKIEALWRTPVCDREIHPTSGYYMRATRRTRPQSKALRFGFAHEEDHGAFSYKSAMDYRAGVRPILSVEGRIGLGPAETREGDIVVVIFGGSVPFVLRPREGGGYHLVGEAFVHGVMDGEMMECGFPDAGFELW